MAPLATGVRTLPVQVLDPAIGDPVSIAIGVTTSSTRPTSLTGCTYYGSQTAAQNVSSPTTPLNFSPTVNIGAEGNYYGWVFVFIAGQIYGIVSAGTVTIGSITVTTGGWQ